MKNKEIEILLHTISYFYHDDSNMDMPESDIEHVEKMIKDGYREGELCCIPAYKEIAVYGWWKIIKD